MMSYFLWLQHFVTTDSLFFPLIFCYLCIGYTKENKYDTWYDDPGNFMKQLIPKEKLGRPIPRWTNPLLERFRVRIILFVVNLTIVTKLMSFESHRRFWYRCVPKVNLQSTAPRPLLKDVSDVDLQSTTSKSHLKV